MSTTSSVKPLTDAQKRVQVRMLSTIAKRNAKGNAWTMPPAYNSNWQRAAADALRRKVVTKNGKGFYLVKKEKKLPVVTPAPTA